MKDDQQVEKEIVFLAKANGFTAEAVTTVTSYDRGIMTGVRKWTFKSAKGNLGIPPLLDGDAKIFLERELRAKSENFIDLLKEAIDPNSELKAASEVELLEDFQNMKGRFEFMEKSEIIKFFDILFSNFLVACPAIPDHLYTAEILDLAAIHDYSAEQVVIHGGPTNGQLRWKLRKIGTNEKFWPAEGLRDETVHAFFLSIPVRDYTPEELAEIEAEEREEA